MRVLTLPHCGWPGTPRNHGIDAARGRYVFFADQDDSLFDGALENLCDFADEHSSDVVVGKVVGIGRQIPRRIFRRDIPRAALGEDPLLELLTPHKLFRTVFLRENDIRFPDGQRAAGRPPLRHAGLLRREHDLDPRERALLRLGEERRERQLLAHRPRPYFPHLEAVLDLVESNTRARSVGTRCCATGTEARS